MRHPFKFLLIIYGCFILSFAGCDKKSTTDVNPPQISTSDNSQTSTILILGDSLTAGYGLDSEEAYPALIQKNIDEQGYPYRIVNGGVTGDTSSGGIDRLDWYLKTSPEILVLALGANDGLRGINPSATKKNLESIITKAKSKEPRMKILLVGMKAPPNMGSSFTEEFQAIYPALADKYNIPLVPFLLEGVAANPELNLSDGIHPNEKGQKLLSKNVWPKLEKLIKTKNRY